MGLGPGGGLQVSVCGRRRRQDLDRHGDPIPRLRQDWRLKIRGVLEEGRSCSLHTKDPGVQPKARNA